MKFNFGETWVRTTKFDAAACQLADRHYSRRTAGSWQFLPPGQTIVLITPDDDAVFAWWRPHPDSGITAMNKLDGWTCAIFRNESATLSSAMILAAERMLVEARVDCGPDGLLTYVDAKKIKSPNPGYCFKRAGYTTRGISTHGKVLLHKPFALAGRGR